MDSEQVNFSSLIDIDELKYLFSDFSDITGFAVGLVDVATNELLLGVGWRDICTKFHRAYPESESRCKESNKKLTDGLKRVGEIHIDRCKNGLVDACTPIIIQEKHLANLFTGQVLFSPPDLEQFKSQAQKFGYDEQRYLKSLASVPVVDEKRVSAFLRYLSQIIISIGQNKLNLQNLSVESDEQKKLPSEKIVTFFNDVTEKKQIEDQLKKKRVELKEANIALKVLVARMEQEKRESEENVAANILSLIDPHLKKLRMSGINKKQTNHIEIIESTLKNLVSPFVRTSVAMNLRLSPAEMQVANLIMQGKSSKAIAELLGLSPQTIDKHRSHIRKKIGVTNRDISLREILTSVELNR